MALVTDPTRNAVAAGDEIIETHISTLVLTDDRVHKFRKPVVTDFCDFTTFEARLADCEQEVALNRRLSPDVYLGVDERPLPGGDGARDACVVMRRLPADRQLTAMIDAGADVRPALRDIARRLADFHAGADRGPEITANGSWSAVRQRWERELAQLRSHSVDPDVLSEVTERVRKWLAGRRGLYEERTRHHHYVDGHGDLRADNIFWLDDGPRILDCIEFDARFRHVDVAEEVAFLMMDLRRLGRPEESDAFRGWYEEFAGTTLPTPLVEHAIAYWALVRAKVAGLRAAQGDEPAAVEMAELLELARAQLEAHRPRLVLIGGLPASGKSTLAEALGAATGWPVLSSDVLRKQRAGLSETIAAAADIDQGLYEPDAVAAIYDQLRDRARTLLERGVPTILDASWTSDVQRRKAAQLAGDTAAELIELRCEVDPETTRARMERRRHEHGASDADIDVARVLAARADPWPGAAPIDTTGPPRVTRDRALALVR